MYSTTHDLKLPTSTEHMNITNPGHITPPHMSEFLKSTGHMTPPHMSVFLKSTGHMTPPHMSDSLTSTAHMTSPHSKNKIHLIHALKLSGQLGISCH